MFRRVALFSILASAEVADAWRPLSRQTTRPTFTKLNANNIVLEPSDDPAAFDSLKIGSARVHRYSVDTDPDSQTEYVMWYHGR